MDTNRWLLRKPQGLEDDIAVVIILPALHPLMEDGRLS